MGRLRTVEFLGQSKQPKGHVAALHWLLQARGQIGARARGDLRPIHLACLGGHTEASTSKSGLL